MMAIKRKGFVRAHPFDYFGTQQGIFFYWVRQEKKREMMDNPMMPIPQE